MIEDEDIDSDDYYSASEDTEYYDENETNTKSKIRRRKKNKDKEELPYARRQLRRELMLKKFNAGNDLK